jgi:hypothetical protein
LEEHMTTGLGTSPTENRKPTPDEQHFLDFHVTVLFNKEKNRFDIGFALDCGTPDCPKIKPNPTIVFYSCPERPCPRA